MWFEFLVVNTTVTFRLCSLKFQGSCLNLISVQRTDLCIYVRGSRIANGLLSSSYCPIQWESLGWLQLDHAGEGDVIRYLNPVNRGRDVREKPNSQQLFLFNFYLFLFLNPRM